MKMQRALKPDAQPFDEIRIVTSPRWKESEMSGDEWRISGRTEFYRKGVLVHSTGWRHVENCAYALGGDLLRACDDGKAFYAGERDVCDQEGCCAKATTFLRLKQRFGRDGNPDPRYDGDRFRAFCDRHKTRGDCGLDDADRNYEAIASPLPPDLEEQP